MARIRRTRYESPASAPPASAPPAVETYVETPTGVIDIITADEIVAAATRRPSKDREEVRTTRNTNRVEGWKKEAWRLYETLGEVTQYADFYGKSMARVRFGAADINGDLLLDVTDDPDNESAIDSDTTPLTQEEIDDVRDVISNIVGVDGTQGSLFRAIATILAVTGDATLCMYPITINGDPLVPNANDFTRPEQEEDDVELEASYRFIVVPSENVDRDEASIKVGRNKTIKVHPEFLWVRIHNPHSRYPEDAFSALCSVIDTGDELQILSRVVAASAMSRVHAGFLKWPSQLLAQAKGTQAMELDSAGHQTRPDRSPKKNIDPQIARLFGGWIEAAENPSAEEIVLPGVVTGPAEFLDSLDHVQPERLIDPEAGQAIKDRQKRMAQTLDLPPEVILGIADTKAWNAWKVNEDTWKSHLEPMAVLIADGISDGLLWPELLERGWAEDRVRLVRMGYDVVDLVIRSDKAEAADEAHDRITISDAAYRTYKGFGDKDAPSEEERAERLEAARIQRGLKDNSGSDRAADGPGGDGPDDSIMASALPEGFQREDELRDTLLSIDREYRLQLEQVIESALEQSVARRGSQLRSLALRHRKTSIGPTLDGLTVEDIPSTLGRALSGEILKLAADDESDEQMLERLLATRFKKLTDQVLARIKATYERVVGVSLTDAELARYQSNRDKAWRQLIRDGAKALTDKMFGEPSNLGEATTVSRETSRAARNTSATLGGQDVNATLASSGGSYEPLASGPALGPDGLEFLNERDIVTRDDGGWEWIYGDPGLRSNPFEDHMNLDSGRNNIIYSGPDDIALSITTSFPHGTHYRPMDHGGCQCDFVQVLLRYVATPA